MDIAGAVGLMQMKNQFDMGIKLMKAADEQQQTILNTLMGVSPVTSAPSSPNLGNNVNILV